MNVKCESSQIIFVPVDAELCDTTGGKRCVFPFKEGEATSYPNLLRSCEAGDKLVSNCIWGKHWGKTGHWCATAVNEDKTFNTWDWCPESCSHPGILVFLSVESIFCQLPVLWPPGASGLPAALPVGKENRPGRGRWPPRLAGGAERPVLKISIREGHVPMTVVKVNIMMTVTCRWQSQ